MSRRIIEGRWSCTSCDTQDILGRHKVCPACGSPRESGEMQFDLGTTQADGSSNAATVREEEVLELAEAGADWFCASCGSGNRGDAQQCIQCGSPRAARPEAATQAPTQAPAKKRKVPYGPLLFLFFIVAVAMYMSAPVETEAIVTARTYHRQVDVERLTPFERTNWRDKLPEAASPPGSEVLAPGRGEITSCRTAVCYPRPPDGGRLLEITDRSWTRTHTFRKMESRSGSGWRNQVPRTTGRYPSAGTGGRQGMQGSPSCFQKEKVPERCRNVNRREQCGTEKSCTVKDMGNGFAEEVCETVPKYCNKTERECDPAQYDDWCTWTELYWGGSRSDTTQGTRDEPAWPRSRPGAREALTRSATYHVETKTLAGEGQGPLKVEGDALLSYGIGQQYFYASSLSRVPQELVREGPGPFEDCGFDIPPNVLQNRDTCEFVSWEWVREPPRQASASQRPTWPDGDLGNDGRETRNEWAEVVLTWARGDDSYTETVLVTADEADTWPLERAVPVRVRYGGELDERLGAWPIASDKPVP